VKDALDTRDAAARTCNAVLSWQMQLMANKKGFVAMNTTNIKAQMQQEAEQVT
jgi:hypothetical protein